MKPTPLFDLGNVIVQVDFAPFMQWLSERARSGAPVQNLLTSSLFYDFEFGNIGRVEFVERVKKLYGAEFSLNEFEQAFCGIFPGLVPGMESVLSNLAAEGPVYCLSNTNEIHLEHCRVQFPVIEKFSKIFASHEIRKRKPYPGIYREVVNQLVLPASEVVFFDDVLHNVEGAHKAGLKAHLFESSSQVLGVLKNFSEMVDKRIEGDSYEGNQ